MSTCFTLNRFGKFDYFAKALIILLVFFFSAAPFSSRAQGPFTIFPSNLPSTEPSQFNDGQSISLGVKFKSTTAGYITGIRFYKTAVNTGVHVGQLWSSTGTLLATTTFINESTSGWQEVDFAAPVAINAGTTYIATYHSPTGYYSASINYFATALTNGPLTGLANDPVGPDGPNGLFEYTASPIWPTNSFNATNYWVDVLFNTTPTDITPPLVGSTFPLNSSINAAPGVTISANFNEALDPATVTASSVFLRNLSTNALVPATISYNAALKTIVLTPNSALPYLTLYEVTIKGGTGTDRVKDIAGNALAADYTWRFTTVAPPNPPPNAGLGGPVLLVGSTSNPFSLYTAEILRAEGINTFDVKDPTQVNGSMLNNYDVVILGELPVSSTEAAMYTTWVNAGGTFIAFKPDPNLNSLLGISAASGTLSDQYLKVTSSPGPASGITQEIIQFHSTANQHTLSGATSLATLYSSATTATTYPAVTTRNVGSNGGKAIAFTYDLARSIVYTRQGNPAWSGQERDGEDPIRSNDLYYGALASDPKPDYVDLDKVAIPQADEQQHLLANIILDGSLHRKPLPKFWFLPRKLKAAVIMTGDDHGIGGAVGRFNQYMTLGPNTQADVDNWNAIRGTSYAFKGTFSDAQLTTFQNAGFEIGLHLNVNEGSNFTETQWNNFWDDQMLQLRTELPHMADQVTHRTHFISWGPWATTAKLEAAKGVRLDVNYYYYPLNWVDNRPGMFTGSGMPMRFADLDGTLIDNYQVPTQLPDESILNVATHISTLLDNAIGSLGYYGVFCANMHTDSNAPTDPGQIGSDAIVAAAIARNIPVISARQMLTWLDGRNGSNFTNMVWNNNTLNFNINVFPGAFKLQAMVPAKSFYGPLISITLNGSPVTYNIETIKGIDYAFFDAAAGNFAATYFQDVTPPVISNIVATPHPNGTVTISWTTDESSNSRVDYGTVSNNLNQNLSDIINYSTSHSLLLTGLTPGTVYHFRVTSEDSSANAGISPLPPAQPLRFVTTSAPCVYDNTNLDFSQGVTGTQTSVVIDGNGALVLRPFVNEEFSSAPAGWTFSQWTPPNGSATFFGGIAIVQGGHLYNNSLNLSPGSSIEFWAKFSNGIYQNIGLSSDIDFNQQYVTIGRASLDPLDGSVMVRWENNGDNDILLGTNLSGSYHRYKINWNATSFDIYVDGVLATTLNRTVSVPMIPQISDYVDGGGDVSVDWIRISPYASPSGTGTFTSRVLGDGPGRNWDLVSWNSVEVDNTSIALSVRTGNTPSPDGTWSAFTTQTNGSQIGRASRYIQYQATLTTANPQNTPILQDVSFSCLAAFPVKLTDFRANTIGKDVKLDWTTASESNNKGFEVQRSLDGQTWTTVGFVQGAGNSNILRNYTYTDRNLLSGKYLYRLRQVDFDGQYSYSAIINININDKQEYSLGQNHPNPFNGTTIIPYSISTNSHVRISIFDMHGRSIRVMDEGQRRAGQYSIQVNLSELRKGVYFYKMEADGFTSTRRMVIQ